MLKYNKNKKRKTSVQEKLNSLDKQRRGHLSFIVSGINGRTVPISVCGCFVCGEASPMIEDQRFLCRECLVVFPQSAHKYVAWRHDYARKNNRRVA